MYDLLEIMFYTGLQTYEVFIFVLATLGNAAYELNYLYYRSEQLSVENSFFLTLIKIRQHKTNFELSHLFNISEIAVVNIWVTWVNFMAKQWREVNMFPDQDIVSFLVLVILKPNLCQQE
jgi:ABC-type glucose/galactose transport system permease subunit